MKPQKILYLITKSNLGEKEHFCSFSPVWSLATGQSLLSEAKQTVVRADKIIVRSQSSND
jgi:hypothetical protein